ncbi:MAG TPA: alpha/beta fold hydrolase [Bdellovibrionota bacterium]|nr:alpha/beta fold hydrolase [Bdellovibrionota bacterium]
MKIAHTLAVFLFLIGSQAFAVSELNYAQEMRERVLPFYALGTPGSFEGAKGVTIQFRKWERADERGALVFLAGRGDPFETYAETLYDFFQAGYSVYTMDHRGQGASDRLVADQQMGYVDRFSRYVEDVKSFLTRVVNAKPHAKRYLVAHSMGGAISALYLTKHQGDFDAASLVTPMIKINTGRYNTLQAEIIARAKKGEQYAPGKGPFDPTETFKADNSLTSSQVRFDEFMRVFRENPRLQLGGASIRWVRESFTAGYLMRFHAPRATTPMLILTAGLDTIVENEQQAEFCGRAPHCVQVRAEACGQSPKCIEAPLYGESKHMILAERDAIREDAVRRITGFFSLF